MAHHKPTKEADESRNMTRSICTALILGALLSVAMISPQAGLAQQKCNPSTPAGSPDTDFVQHANGTVSDNTTGLMWMRCALGQEWKAGDCRGPADTFTWAEALKAAQDLRFGGFSDWRLPNKNQLSSIVEERCASPAINSTIFPSTTTTFFWTSSPYAGLSASAWSVDFGYGVITSTDKSGKLPVRLVRWQE